MVRELRGCRGRRCGKGLLVQYHGFGFETGVCEVCGLGARFADLQLGFLGPLAGRGGVRGVGMGYLKVLLLVLFLSCAGPHFAWKVCSGCICLEFEDGTKVS